jgi:hypothetical protein
MTSNTIDWPKFGTPAEWQAFEKRHPAFLERFPRLFAGLEAVFLRSLKSSEPIDVLLFFLGREAADDFFEIVIMCGNAEGHGAQKLLRTFFERVVLLKIPPPEP